MKPVDVGSFLKDETVQEIIDSTKGSVIIDHGSDDYKNLKAGNGKISGLTPNKYYKIEVIEDNVPEEIYFVKANGTLSSDLKDIGRVIGGVITGLENDVTYRVKSAKLYTNSTKKIEYFTLTDSTPLKEAAVTNGTVTISENRPNCYFNLADTIAATNYYEVMKIRISGSGTETPWRRERTSAYKLKDGNTTIDHPIKISQYQKFNGILDIGIYEYDSSKLNVTPGFLDDKSIMELPAIDTENDYVFVEYYGDPAITRDFYVLTVNVKTSPPPENGGIITINPPALPQDTLILTPPPTGNIITILLTTGSETDKTITVAGGSDYKWYYNGNTDVIISTENKIVIGTTTGLTVAGTYTIMVEGTVGGIVYSKWFILKITSP